MKARHLGLLVSSAIWITTGVLACLAAPPAGEEESPFAAADAKILTEIRDHSEAMQNLEYLSDNIGPRLTGSPLLQQANEWSLD